MAIELQLTKAQKMRTDGTVGATNIHFPSDNSLLVDGVRVMSRLLYKAKEILSSNSKIHPRLFQNRYRTARKISRNIDSLSQARSQWGRQNREQAYRRLLEVTQASLKQAQKVQVLLKDSTDLKAAKVGRALAIFIPRVTQVITQSSRRVLRQERVPAHEKLVSIFEAHTDIICRGKPNLSTEFGHKVWLDEVDGGLISNYRVLKGNPHDTQQWVESLDQHLQIFGRPPKQASADRGVYSHPNENYAQKLGVKQVILPKGGYKSKERDNFERKRNFQKGRRWHNGIEGRISVLTHMLWIRTMFIQN
jgi:transposase, IS5 family